VNSKNGVLSGPENMRTSITLLLGIILMFTVACSSASGEVASIERKDVAQSIVEEGDLDRSLVRGEAEMVAWADCLRAQGIDVTDPVVNYDGNIEKPVFPTDFDIKRNLQQLEVCDVFIQAFTSEFEQDKKGDADVIDDLLALADCLRTQGIDLKDPVITNDGIDFEIPGIKKDPTVMTAYANCSSGISKAGK